MPGAVNWIVGEALVAPPLVHCQAAVAPQKPEPLTTQSHCTLQLSVRSVVFCRFSVTGLHSPTCVVSKVGTSGGSMQICWS